MGYINVITGFIMLGIFGGMEQNTISLKIGLCWLLVLSVLLMLLNSRDLMQVKCQADKQKKRGQINGISYGHKRIYGRA